MAVLLQKPSVGGLDAVLTVLREWQSDAAPLQLHPGDLGWFWRFGAEATAEAVRAWSRDGQIVAVGLLDGPDLLRLTTAPEARRDEELARQLVADLGHAEAGVFGAGKAYAEAPEGALVKELLSARGWQTGETWTPLRRYLTDPVEVRGVRVEVVGPETVPDRTMVQRAAFDNSTFTDERWRWMASGLPYADARCLVAYDDRDVPVAAITVWSAGPGRPGLIEPMGVHPGHRGRGYGWAITLAGAAALRELGSSSALVCTQSSNLAGVATYAAAGFVPQPLRTDRYREA